MVSDMTKFRHVILTRFNCRFSRNQTDREMYIRSRPGWLESRFELFERYCLPSVRAQSNQNFVWYIYFDSKTPSHFLERARMSFEQQNNILIKLCNVYTLDTLRFDLMIDLGDACDWLLTTRLDNDDGLHKDFVSHLHREVCFGRREALNFPIGLVFHRGHA